MVLPHSLPHTTSLEGKNCALFFPFVIQILFCNILYLAPARNCPESAIALNSQGLDIVNWAIVTKNGPALIL